MIERLQNEAGKAVTAMQNGRGKTRQTLDQAAEADEVLANIVRLVASITNMNAQIASADEEQTGVSSQIDHNVVHIAQSADHAVNGIEQITMASGELARLGEGLRGLVNQFKI